MATKDRKYKVDYRYQPFVGKFTNFKPSGCSAYAPAWCRPVSASPFRAGGLIRQQSRARQWVRNHYLVDSVAEEVERWKSTNDMVFMYGGVGPSPSHITQLELLKHLAPDEFEGYLLHLIGEKCSGDRNEIPRWMEMMTTCLRGSLSCCIMTIVLKLPCSCEVEAAQPLSEISIQFPDIYIEMGLSLLVLKERQGRLL
ncbi:unnamed protein product [Fraxinus pennsylvanica]|uniref:Uncharacterized protein n=1 Tax=Fraxinus pennsylvanica TaxID=56036 RepID=A0AAD1Z6E0_9LAMI|nr:unnamed protein product [Fraxinus pennsylvanica]